jgi:DNA-binding transcriptional LysR family regulator
MLNVTVRQLQVFVAVAEQLSLARVAEQLRLTPSAVSFQIRKIEEQTGFELFERIGRGVALTDAGATLLAYARLMLQSLEVADQAMAGLRGADSGRVRLGLVSTAKYIVPHMIARFRETAPNVAVQLREGNRRAVLDLLLEGEIDLAIMGQPPEGADVLAERIASHPSVIIGPPGHRLRATRSVAPAALAEDWFVIREDGSGTRSLSDRFFRAAGFEPKVAMESSSNEMIKQSVMAGIGLALISRHTISLELALGLLVTLPVEDFPVLRAWFVVQRRTLPLLPVQARLRGFLVERGQAVIDEIERGHAKLAMQFGGRRRGK